MGKLKPLIDFGTAEMMRTLHDDLEEYGETKRCENSCAHFDLLNQCCWLITEKTPGLMTDVQEGDYCFHGLKEDY